MPINPLAHRTTHPMSETHARVRVLAAVLCKYEGALPQYQQIRRSRGGRLRRSIRLRCLGSRCAVCIQASMWEGTHADSYRCKSLRGGPETRKLEGTSMKLGFAARPRQRVGYSMTSKHGLENAQSGGPKKSMAPKWRSGHLPRDSDPKDRVGQSSAKIDPTRVE